MFPGHRDVGLTATVLRFSELRGQSVLFFFFSLSFFRAVPVAMEVSRLGVKLELQLLAYTTATAMQDLSHICHTPQLMAVLDP